MPKSSGSRHFVEVPPSCHLPTGGYQDKAQHVTTQDVCPAGNLYLWHQADGKAVKPRHGF
jgi:hypothetical protein